MSQKNVCEGINHNNKNKKQTKNNYIFSILLFVLIILLVITVIYYTCNKNALMNSLFPNINYNSFGESITNSYGEFRF